MDGRDQLNTLLYPDANPSRISFISAFYQSAKVNSSICSRSLWTFSCSNDPSFIYCLRLQQLLFPFRLPVTQQIPTQEVTHASSKTWNMNSCSCCVTGRYPRTRAHRRPWLAWLAVIDRRDPDGTANFTLTAYELFFPATQESSQWYCFWPGPLHTMTHSHLWFISILHKDMAPANKHHSSFLISCLRLALALLSLSRPL